MLKKKSDLSSQSFDTLIGKSASFEGDLKTKGLLRIDGKYTGNIDVEGDIIIGSTGKIQGNMKANNIEVSGEIDGNVYCMNQLKISQTGKIYGDIEVNSFVVEEKGVFDGNCKMNYQKVEVKQEEKKTANIKAV